jgi:tetratricopeptide (TPR) repeat protein
MKADINHNVLTPTTPKVIMNLSELILTVCVASTFTLSARAEIKTAAPSPAAEVKQVIGLTEFTIKYSRPGVKGRTIYGGLVPYDELWRTGANAPTRISFDKAIKLEGKSIPAGDYVLFTIPGEREWTVIIYGDVKVRNTGAYSKDQDIARITVAPVKLADAVESFTIGFDNLRDDSATLNLDWANTRVPVKINLDTAAQSSQLIDEAMKNPANLTAGEYASAANFYFQQNLDLDKAAAWMAKAVAMNKDAYYWQHTYAKILAKQGKKEQALEEAKASLAKAKAAEGGDNGYIKMNEALIASLK